MDLRQVILFSFKALDCDVTAYVQVYVVDLLEDIDVCVERNVHNRSRNEIEKVCYKYFPSMQQDIVVVVVVVVT